MTVIACHKIPGRDGYTDLKGVRTWTQPWRVQTNDPLDGPQVVANHSELPALYSSYSSGNDSDSYALLVKRVPREEGDGSRKSWIVTCEFRTDAIQRESLSSPLLDPVRYSVNFDQFSTIARQSLETGERLINSMGQVFTPPPEVDQSRPVYAVQRNESSINLPFIIDMIDSVNQAAWKGCAPRTVKCKAIQTGDIQQRNGIEYYTVAYEFHLNPETWDLRVLNQGTRYVDPTIGVVSLPPGAEPLTLYVKDDTIVPRGATVSIDAAFYDQRGSAASDVVYLRYKYYKVRNFGLFNF
jgi:hypothetical protein